MIEPFDDLPDNIIGFEAKGEVEAADYRDVLVPAVEAALAKHDKIRLLYVLGADFEGFSGGAMWEDGKLGVEHLTCWEKMAVVSDKDWIRHSINVFGYMIPGRVKVFTSRDEARAWVVD